MVDFTKLIARQKEKHNIEMKPARNPNVSISVAGADYSVKFGWDKELIEKFKREIPESERKWHRARAVWLVRPDEIMKAIEVIQAHTGQAVSLPADVPTMPTTIEKTFLLEYLGATKDRGKRTSAYGSVNGEWSADFSEEVLKDFFEKREKGKPDGLQTLYQVLCVFESATDQEIKSAYRRLARQWHPDVCREDNATEMFLKLDEAYKILSDSEKKRRYDAGLYFERQGQQDPTEFPVIHKYGYRAPLRCGQITARGTVRLMRFVVSEILKWDDVIKDGKVMTSSWPKGSDSFVIEWLNQSPF
jgi:hypothetical protein